MVAPATVSSAPSGLDAVAVVELEAALRVELDGQRRQVAELEATIAELSGSTDADSAYARDVAERSTNLALEVIAEVEHALERISAATYGTCEVCSGAIAPARLEALPHARHCVSCPPPPALSRRS